MRVILGHLVLALIATATQSSYGWGPGGHQTIAAIAAGLIADSGAEARVNALLGGLSLSDAAVWADCLKGVNPTTLRYESAGRYPECQPFETAAGEADMVDFVGRNSRNCPLKPAAEACHKQYHYADVAIQHDTYERGWVGTRDDDIVAAVKAVIRVLKGSPAPPPFNIKDRREALILLAHYIGDLHQPLHVGAVYLEPGGTPVNPDLGIFNPDTDTRGGNDIEVLDRSGRHRGELHGRWDSIPPALRASRVDGTWLAQARLVPRTVGPDVGWPEQWASDTLLAARSALAGLQFGPRTDGRWSVVLPRSYNHRMTGIKRKQLTLAGARFAQLLQDLFR